MKLSKRSRNQAIIHWTFLAILIIVPLCLLYFRHYLSIENLKLHRQQLLDWTDAHYIQASFSYMLLYILAVIVSIPMTFVISIAGGFLFGIWLGTFYIIIAEVVGGVVIFLTVKMFMADFIRKRSGAWITAMGDGFKKNAFHYLILLRLLLIFPLWIVNVMPALMNVSFVIFITATAIGVIPASFVHAAIGNGLGQIIENSESFGISLLMKPSIFLPLLALALLTLIPLVYRMFKKD